MKSATETRRSRSKEADRAASQDFSVTHLLHGPDGDECHLLGVVDFSTGSRPTATGKARSFLESSIPRLQQLRLGNEPGFFLETLAAAFNDYLLSFKEPGQVSPARCTAVFAIIKGDRCHYLSVGDARLALVRAGQILLPLGADWHVANPLEPNGDTHERKLGGAGTPKFLGAEYADGPLGSVRSLALCDDDVLLLYSDGLESVPPTKRVQAVLENRPDPVRTAAALVDLASNDDDVTVTAVVGPFLRQDLSAALDAKLQQVIGPLAQKTDVEMILTTASKTSAALNDLKNLVENSLGKEGTVARLSQTVAQLQQDVKGLQGLGSRCGDLEQKLAQLKTAVDPNTSQNLRTRLSKLEEWCGSAEKALKTLETDNLDARIKGLEDLLTGPGAALSRQWQTELSVPLAIQVPDEFGRFAESIRSELALIVETLRHVVDRFEPAPPDPNEQTGPAPESGPAEPAGGVGTLDETAPSEHRVTVASVWVRRVRLLWSSPKVRRAAELVLSALLGATVAVAAMTMLRAGSDPAAGPQAPAETSRLPPGTGATPSTDLDASPTRDGGAN